MVVDLTHVGRWPDAEDVFKSVARGVEVDGKPVSRVGRETAAGRDLPGGTIRVERIGGAPNRDETADFPLMEMAFFGADYAQAEAMKRAFFLVIKAAVGEQLHANAVLAFARVESGPIRPPWSSAETSTRRVIENWRASWAPYFD